MINPCVMAAGSLCPETSMIPLGTGQTAILGIGPGRLWQEKLQQLCNGDKILFFNGQARLASLEGSGSCFQVLDPATAMIRYCETLPGTILGSVTGEELSAQIWLTQA